MSALTKKTIIEVLPNKQVKESLHGKRGEIQMLCTNIYPFHYVVNIENGKEVVLRGDEIKPLLIKG